MVRSRSIHTSLIALVVLVAATPDRLAADTKVTFDIPSKVECRDVTPEKCAAAHPTMKVIEAKFRISSSFIEGSEDSAVDLVYMISSPDMRLKVLDFLPNTTLESTTAEDLIDVVDNTENSDATTGEARVGYSVLSLKGSKNQFSRKTESNRYQRIAPKNLVLAAGTVNRGNGVIYKLRPSQGSSLEGAKEFVLLCIVPKTWRGDWCSVICSSRSNKKTAISSTVAISGIEHAHVGLYLTGDHEAGELADAMTAVQYAHGGLLSKYLSRQALHSVDDLHMAQTIQLTKGSGSEWYSKVLKIAPSSKQTSLDEAKMSLLSLESRLSQLAGKSSSNH